MNTRFSLVICFMLAVTGRAAAPGRAAADDLHSVRVCRAGLESVLTFMNSRPDLFPAEPPQPPRLPTREQKEIIWNTWQRFLDYQLALETAAPRHRDLLTSLQRPDRETFALVDSAFQARYRFALEFIDRAEKDPALDPILNDAVPERGLPAGTYGRLKQRYLHVGRATEFAALEVIRQFWRAERARDARADADRLWQWGKGRGEALTVSHAFRVIRDAGFPIQAGVSAWMGDTKVHRKERSLISAEQIQALAPRLEPGDILLERREWYLSNIGLPGFWPHAALYIGTPAERRHLGIEDQLRASAPAAYRHSLAGEHGHPYRVLEAISEGVMFTTLEHSAACDSLAVLRPRLPAAAKAQAILRAFGYAGRPYDFNFDFATDAALVCTELIYKSYEPAPGFTGLRLPLVTMLGRQVTPANDIVRQFAAEAGTPAQQLDLVLFLDGHERDGRAVAASADAFCASWRRPKWHILSQGLEPRGLRRDEAVIFFPTLAGRAADGQGWEAEIHGWVFERERRRWTLRALQSALGLKVAPAGAAERELFAERARWFLVDNERGKRVEITAGADRITLPATGADGHFQARHRVAAAGGVAGEIQWLEDTGISVISDIDDTIKISKVTDSAALVRNTFYRPFRPVPGMAALYQQWAAAGAAFHYVSASPWHLYPALREFTDAHGFPLGSFHLKPFRWKDENFFNLWTAPEPYKLGVLEPLLARFPRRQFLLVGDSGERDPEVYGELARRHPRQVTRILIRDVTGETATAARYQRAFRDLPVDGWTVFREPPPAFPLAR